jgi:hypothetical protein
MVRSTLGSGASFSGVPWVNAAREFISEEDGDGFDDGGDAPNPLT